MSKTEQNNSTKKELKTVYIGKNHQFTHPEQALFNHKENTRFIIEKGTYTCNIELNDCHNIVIEGNNQVFFKGADNIESPVLSMDYSTEIEISGIAFTAYPLSEKDTVKENICVRSNILIETTDFKFLVLELTKEMTDD